jgi:GPH family glycoside/pentoside/hexuronide:cation symporter
VNFESDRVSVREKICYAMGDASANIAWRGVAAFLFIVYTDVFGLNPAAVGTLMLVARLGDGISDVAMGVIADRTNTRWGKYRPWMLWSALPLGVMLSMLFTCPESLSMTGRLVYAYVTYIVFTLVYTAQGIPYGALLSVMSADDKERTSIGSYKMVGAFAGGMLVQGLLLVLKEYFDSYTIPIYILSAVLVVLMPITFFGTRERVEPPKDQRNDVLADLKQLMVNVPWIVLLVVSLLYNVYNSVKQGITIVYFTHYMNRELLCATYMTALMLASVAGAAITSPLARRFGKRNLFVGALVASGAANSLLWFCGAADVTAIFALGVVSELFAAIFPTLCFVMLGDVADYSEWRNGRRATGLIYSATSFAMKFGGGIAGLLIGVVLARYGYDGKVAASIPGAIPGIKMLMSWIPGVIAAATAVVMALYPITTSKMDQITADLLARRNRE